MPKYIVERVFPDGFELPISDAGRATVTAVGENNAQSGVHWITSYVTADRRRTYCLYDSPDRGALRQAASLSGLPIDSITEVNVLDPAFYSPVEDGEEVRPQ